MLYIVTGTAIYLGYWLILPLRENVPLFLLWTSLAFVFLFLVYRAAEGARVSLSALLLLALIVRLALLFQPPSLSEDVYRYLWDGMLSANGVSPYPLPPEQLELFQEQEPDLYRQVAHRSRTAIYPPAAQLLFWISYRLFGPSVAGWKLLLLLAEAAFLWLLLKGFRVTRAHLALWALNPLVVLETYSSGHLDLIAVALTGAAFYSAGRLIDTPLQTPAAKKTYLALTGGLLALASLIKIFPLFTVPLVLAALRTNRSRLLLLSSYLTGLALPSLLFLLLFPDPLQSIYSFWGILNTFQDIWRFNSLPFFLLQSQRAWIGPLSILLFLLVTLFLAGWHRGEGGLRGLLTTYYFQMAALYALSHTVHPWYLSWVLLSYPLIGTAYRAGLYLSGACLVSYLSYWWEPAGDRAWLLWIEYLPFYLLLLLDIRASRNLRESRRVLVRSLGDLISGS